MNIFPGFIVDNNHLVFTWVSTKNNNNIMFVRLSKTSTASVKQAIFGLILFMMLFFTAVSPKVLLIPFFSFEKTTSSSSTRYEGDVGD